MRAFYEYVWRSSSPRQIVLIVLALMAALLAMAPLELQRHIINTLAGRERVEKLAWLCGAYLIAALVISGLKYTVNIKSAGLGEFMIRSLREKILSSGPASRSNKPPGETAKDESGTIVTMIAAEAEAVGKFVGDCISTPIVQAGTLLSVLGYMLYVEPLLGLVVLLIAVPQFFIVPIIQRRINTQVRERVRTLRHAGDLIVEDMQAGPRIRYVSQKRGWRGLRDDLWRASARVQAQVRIEISGRWTAVGRGRRPAPCRRDHGSQRKN